jgi:hypothetical protein
MFDVAPNRAFQIAIIFKSSVENESCCATGECCSHDAFIKLLQGDNDVIGGNGRSVNAMFDEIGELLKFFCQCDMLF